jgi:CO/xanthine dehydrogenase Mo-binding subunit
LKGDTYPEEALVLLASEVVGRPVKWSASRSEAFVLDSNGRDQRVHAEMALDRDGRIMAIRAKALHNVGAYMVGASFVPLLFSLKVIPSVYRVETLDLSTSAVFTHTAPTMPYRGAGRPEATYVVERLLDLAAMEMKIDRLEIRRLDDFGRLINPLIVSGQVHGAVAQGLGQALGEQVIYDEGGQLLTASFMDYALPRADGVPAFMLSFNEQPCRTNPLGVKGAGEGGCVAAPPRS